MDGKNRFDRARKLLLALKEYPDTFNRCHILLGQENDSSIFDAINSPDMNERKAGVFLMVCLIGSGEAEERTRIENYMKVLLTILTTSSDEVTNLVSRTIAYLILTTKSYAVEMVEISLNQCFEWLEEINRNEHHRLAAVVLARDLAFFTSSHFFQRLPQFFNCIFKIIRDQKYQLRIASKNALQAALCVASQREAKHKNEWYKKCFNESCISDATLSKEDNLHASLLIFNEILRISNPDVERIRLEILNIPFANRIRSVISTNPIEWINDAMPNMVAESRTCRALVAEGFFPEILKRCMDARQSKSLQCQFILLEIFPRIASFSDMHSASMLVNVNELSDYSLQMVGKCQSALLTLGLLAIGHPYEFKAKVPQVLTIINQQLQQAIAKKKSPDPIVFKCLSLFVRSQKESLNERIHDLLPTLFLTGISEDLTKTLHEIIIHVPNQKTDVLDGLMEQLYSLLMNQARPSKLAPPTSPPISNGPIQPSNISLTKLALNTLGEFDFTRHALQMFIRYIAQGYLTSDSSDIRLTSVYCCAKIIKPFIKVYEVAGNIQKTEVYSLIKSVLECLIKTAIIDSEVEVRLSVIKCFCVMDVDFLRHLAQNEMLETLFCTLNDESYEVQEQSAELLGLLSDLNPSFVFLKLRRLILETISQLVNSRSSRIEEHSARIITRLAKQSSKFMSSYMNSLLLALTYHLRNGRKNDEATLHVLNALSELTLIGGIEVVQIAPQVFPHLITHLNDSTSLSKREAALRAMGGLCQSTCYVVEPCKDHPQLMDCLLALLKTEMSLSMRRLTMKVLGIIGALDPYTYKVYLGRIHSTHSKSLALTLPNSAEHGDLTQKGVCADIIQWLGYERCTLAEYYPSLTIVSLIQMLSDGSNSNIHKDIVQSLLQIFTCLGPRSSQYINKLVPRLITLTETCKPENRKFFLKQFGKLATVVRLQLRPCMKQIISIIGKAWSWSDDVHFRSIVIEVLEEIGKAFEMKFAPYVTDLCPYLISVVNEDQSKDRKITMQALTCVTTISPCLGTHIHLILPPVLTVMNDRLAPEKVRLLALDATIVMVRQHPISEKAPLIMQTWMRCLQIKTFQKKLFDLLMTMMGKKWEKLSIYFESIDAAIKRYRIPLELTEEYFQALSEFKNNQGLQFNEFYARRQLGGWQTSAIAKQMPLLPLLDSSIEEQNEKTDDIALNSSVNSHRVRESHKNVEIGSFKRLWIAGSLTSREDWLQWLSTLRNHFIRKSPSSSICACAVLAETNESLSKELFNAAFMSVWTEISEFEQNCLTAQLIEVINLCPHPEPIQTILNLAEFMDHSEKGPLPISYGTLSGCAEQTRAYAKALRYKEQEILAKCCGPTPEDCQTLITLFNKLNLEEGAAGVVQYAERHNMEISGRWYEKLGEWEKALEMYNAEIYNIGYENSEQKRFNRNSVSNLDSVSNGQKQRQISTASLKTSNSTPLIDLNEQKLHQIRCLEALSQWSQLNEASQELLNVWDVPSTSVPQNFGTQMYDQSKHLNTTLSEVEKRQKLAKMAARGAWAVGDYDRMSEYVQITNENTQEGSFLRAVLAIRHNEFEKAYGYINKVRDMFDSELIAMFNESYERAYGAMVLAQELTEMEEAIEYKMIPERQMRIALLWSRRIQGCRRSMDHWRRILMVRSTVLSKNELRPLWIKFSSIARRENRHIVARNTLQSLLDLECNTSLFSVQLPLDKPQLALAVCKQLWADGQRRLAISNLDTLTQTMHRLIDRSRQILTREQLEPMSRIISKCYLKLANWHSSLSAALVSTTRLPNVMYPQSSELASPSANTSIMQQQYLWQVSQNQRSPMFAGVVGVSNLFSTSTAAANFGTPTLSIEHVTSRKLALQYYINATSFDPSWYKAWRCLATTYYNLVMADRRLVKGNIINSSASPDLPVQPISPHPNTHLLINQMTQTQPQVPLSPVQSPLKQHQQLLSLYAVQAIRCFFKAIQLAEGSRLDDTLRLLMLWFDYGERPEILEQLRDSLKLVPVESWLEVIPQLISHLDSQQNTGMLMQQLVIDISKVHPQAIVYALTAATKSRKSQRSKVAKDILDIVAESKPTLVEQALLLNSELIRCAILWHEQWHEALEDASRFYFEQKNTDEMLNVLRPLHQKIEQGHITLKEQSFNQTYFKELKDAFEHCEVYRRTGNQKEITAAWDLYYNVFKRISSQLRQMNALELGYISPSLAKAHNLEISVPGTYDPSGQLVTIVSINSHLQVIMSKQRPRKVKMRGSDGKEYAFLLKGHEDPRQDERVMQLFGLINSLILREAETYRRDLCIQRYSIIPLSQSSGLIGWVPNCDTLHALIRDYREKRKIHISIEHTEMEKLVINFEKLTLLQKVEVFEEALRTTPGDDLRQTLWLKSPNSEIWFDRRTNYTRSMACMSMVGYILGLGDRHPSNLMLDRLSGKIVHIDFGDCFEVAMKREKFPEKIPFRLTRMLTKAMEITGIDGNYRLTCERILRLLRNNNDSILAVLEAFVYDPVLNWRPTETLKKHGGDLNPIATHFHQHNAETDRSEGEAINRVKAKLCGRDFNPTVEISVQEQVSRLVEQATLNDNLCQCFIGWCPFW